MRFLADAAVQRGITVPRHALIAMKTRQEDAVTTQHEERADDRTEFDRLIDALEPRPEVVPSIVFVPLGGRKWHLARVLSQLRRRSEATQQLVVFVEGESDALLLRQQLDQMLYQRAEREEALRAVAAQALERLQDSTRELADRLERQVEDLEAQRNQAAEVEGERESDDPWVILEMLPEHCREEFEADYRRALRAAGNPKGFLALRRTLRNWRVRADWYSDPSYQGMHEAFDRGERPAESRSWAEVREEWRTRGILP
jgi:hypothetical protein